MAKGEKLLAGMRQHLQEGEEVVHSVEGAYETKIMGQDSVRNGIFAATDRRLVFYAKKMTGYDLESFPYENVSSLEMGKNMMGHHIKFFASGNEVRMKWIKNGEALDGFMSHVRDRMAAPKGGGGAAPDGALDKLKKLGELKEAGVITEEEFAEKKAKLLEEL